VTEDDWLSATDPDPLLEFLPGRGAVSERKLRLFACGCCRLVFNPFSGAFAERVVRAAERFADGGLPRAVLDRVHAAALAGAPPATAYQAHVAQAVAHAAGPDIRATAGLAAEAAAYAAADLPAEGGRPAARRPGGGYAEYAAERAAQADLLRDVFGNPFRPARLDPAWRTSAVLGLAHQMYAADDYGIAPVLADALQDAGCPDEEITAHLRGPAAHVRGCWVIDLLLGKE
jgi:hypothetical protein